MTQRSIYDEVRALPSWMNPPSPRQPAYHDGFNDGFAAARASVEKVTAPFLVFSDAPNAAYPRMKHSTRAIAEKEAARLAELTPGVNFYVLGSFSVTSANKPTASKRNLA